MTNKEEQNQPAADKEDGKILVQQNQPTKTKEENSKDEHPDGCCGQCS